MTTPAATNCVRCGREPTIMPDENGLWSVVCSEYSRISGVLNQPSKAAAIAEWNKMNQSVVWTWSDS